MPLSAQPPDDLANDLVANVDAAVELLRRDVLASGIELVVHLRTITANEVVAPGPSKPYVPIGVDVWFDERPQDVPLPTGWPAGRAARNGPPSWPDERERGVLHVEAEVMVFAAPSEWPYLPTGTVAGDVLYLVDRTGVQDWMTELLWRAWPGCREHALPLAAGSRDGCAVWSCERDPAGHWVPVGGLAAGPGWLVP